MRLAWSGVAVVLWLGCGDDDGGGADAGGADAGGEGEGESEGESGCEPEPAVLLIDDLAQDGALVATEVARIAGRTSSLVVGDVDGDGAGDAVALDSGRGLSVLLGLASEAPAFIRVEGFFPAGSWAELLACADLDGDGDADLVYTGNETVAEGNVAHAEQRVTQVLVSQGDGSFAAGAVLDPGGGALGNDAVLVAVVGDVDGQGGPDVVLAGEDGVGVTVLLGDGGGGFGAPQPAPAGPPNYVELAVGIGDLDGDGVVDVVTAADWTAWGQGTAHETFLSVYSGLGGGVLDGPVRTPIEGAEGRARSVDLVDGDADGVLDALLYRLEREPPAVEWKRALGDGTYDPLSALHHLDVAVRGDLHVADVDDNGTPDLVFVSNDGVVVRRVSADGTVGEAAEARPTGIGLSFVGDVTGDGRADAILIQEDGCI